MLTVSSSSGDARMITSTTPMFVAVLGRVFLKEPCGLFEAAVIAATLGGIFIVMQPPFVFEALLEETVEQDVREPFAI